MSGCTANSDADPNPNPTPTPTPSPNPDQVYRGLAGGVLPTEFWKPNEHGVKGGIEYGFSSTTTDRSKAVHFATAGGMSDGESTCSTIFEMQAEMQ